MNTKETNQKIDKVISSMIKNKIDLTIDNCIIQSLFFSGGTLDEDQVKEYLKEYIGIGFCQPKFYKSYAWRRASNVMILLCDKKLAYPHDYGRGKGKYSTNEKDLFKIVDLL